MNVYYEKCHYEMMTMKSVTMKPYTADFSFRIFEKYWQIPWYHSNEFP